MKTLGYFLLNLAQAFFLCVWTSFWISFALVAMVVTMSRELPLRWARTLWGPGIVRGAGAKIFVTGGEDVDWSRPYVFVSNHQSFFDIPVCFVSLLCNVRFVAKSSLAYVPFLGWYMWATGMVFVDRGKSESAIRSLRRAGERIRKGASILAFPEGTRSRDGKIRGFKKGAFVVALESRVPVVPIAIRGAREILSADGFRVRAGDVHVKIGAPIPTADLSIEDRGTLVSRVRAEMIALHESIGGEGGAT
jgi:1-acyl-sn-glycerol-3-phosphate acyltransferase